ncbi:type II toxin-antitoxin system Phd/YefM family antitoxin [Streptomyces sp. AM6-12]|uniref:type II toxin-antitoxin system Phd/YefM family antitoxin n=1 Tax=Streptomyces sp. AM6-12 TaxID=3345149 RepID=UPI00378BD0F0
MSEREIGIEDARKILGDLVDEVRYTGAVVTLTRYGKPVARICPVEDDTSEGEQA